MQSSSRAPQPPAEIQIEAAQPGAQITRNRRDNPVHLGTIGKYYCGKRVLDCRCCDGNCGPTKGCNCADCMQLDVSSRHLPPGQLVNNEGRVSRRSSNCRFYCRKTGRELRRSGNSSLNVVETKCSSEGPGAVQCASCKALEGPRYATVRSDAAIAGAGSPEDSGVSTSAESEPGIRQHFSVPPPPFRPAFSFMPSTGPGLFHPPHHTQTPPPPFNSLPPPGMTPRSRYRGPSHFSPRGTTAPPPPGGDRSENGSNRVECRPSWVVRPI